MAVTASKVSWWRGWLPLLVLPGLVLWLTPEELPAWQFMWLLAFAIYCGCKWFTWRRTPLPAAVPGWKHAAYLLGWPGLDAAGFLTADSVSKPTVGEWLLAVGKTAFGGLLLFVVARLLPQEWTYVVGWVGMVGIAFALHFGLFHLLACFWRSVGLEARLLMVNPARSVSVSEFWGKRWNTAFRDLTHRFLFRPLIRKTSGGWALLMVFLFSGVVHDLVISVPAGSGYGGPTVFFLIQAAAIFLERTPQGKQLGIGQGVRGWLFTTLVILGPAYLLFHAPFVNGVVVPFMQAIRAIP